MVPKDDSGCLPLPRVPLSGAFSPEVTTRRLPPSLSPDFTGRSPGVEVELVGRLVPNGLRARATKPSAREEGRVEAFLTVDVRAREDVRALELVAVFLLGALARFFVAPLFLALEAEALEARLLLDTAFLPDFFLEADFFFATFFLATFFLATFFLATFFFVPFDAAVRFFAEAAFPAFFFDALGFFASFFFAFDFDFDFFLAATDLSR